MGQTQFLPSNFLAYAVDADGDGRRDIWGSMADVMASTANFLARSGWQADQPWGVEVHLPPLRYNNSISYALAVGLLAQRLTHGPGVQAPWPRDLPALTRSQLLALPTALNQRGFASGTPDGMMGPATRDGLRRYQRSVGLPADGYPTLDLLQRLEEP